MTYRCPQCRTRRSTAQLMVQHIAATGHRACQCGGYHYPHRPDSPDCVKNTFSILRVMRREGVEPDVILQEAANLAYDLPGKPFEKFMEV